MQECDDGRALSISDTDFELIAESIPHIVWVAAPDGSVEYFNHRGTEYTGLAYGAAKGWDWLALIHPADIEPTEREWRDAGTQDALYEIDYRLRRFDGEFRWQACSALPVRNELAGELLSRVRQVREALKNRRFVLYAQPIMHLRSGRIAYRELLIRMLSASGETIPPRAFLPIAERFSLIGAIDRWVVSEALVLAHKEPLTVNLSARSTGHPQILTAVRKAIASGLDPGPWTARQRSRVNGQRDTARRQYGADEPGPSEDRCGADT